jgi:SWI/SNF-related matrix-associated actin-dependent regulator 1 of chromatin subfamily A
LININEIQGYSALSLLEAYKGINPYLKKMRNDHLLNKSVKLTDTQVKYIIDNHQKEPILINRVVGITSFFGEELQRQEGLKFLPERILIEYILADSEKTFHIYGKLKKNQVDSKMYWLPKTQVLDDPYFETINVDVDFEKYNKVLAKQGKTLYEHQKSGVKFLIPRNGAILADDMGLGKSMQSIIAALESGAKNILVVCPSSVKINWKREIKMFSNDVTIIDGKIWDQAKFTIINYDILKNFHTLEDTKKKKKSSDTPVILNRQLANAKFDLLIVDEAHNLKNNKSIRGEIMADLSVNFDIEKVWLLTGTPIANRPMDFFNLLKIIKAPIAKNWVYFTTRYCEGRKFFRTLKNGLKKQIWLTDGASNLDELASKTKNLMLRRLKTDVLDMPDKVVTPFYHQLDKKGWARYDQLWDDYLEKRKEEKKRGPIQRDLVELILLRKFIALEAISETIEMVENAIESGRKCIIFTSFTEELNELANHFGKLCVIHNGPMTTKAKQISVDSFQNNPNIKVFIGNVRSAGVGITLTEGTYVVFNSFDWVSGINEQAEDRAFRIGQTKDVNIVYQLFEDTISTRMWETVRNKKDIIATIMGDNKLSDEEMIALMTEQLMNETND